MWRRIAAVAGLLLITTSAGPAGADEVRGFITVEDSNADAKRAELVGMIWPDGYPTGRHVVTPISFWPSKLNAMTYRTGVQVATMEFNVSGLTSLGFMLAPSAITEGWAIVHQGHLPHDTTRYLEAGVAPTADALLAAGWGVVVLQMPLQGWNLDHAGDGFTVPSTTQGTAGHKAMWSQAGYTATMLRFYLNPVVETLNELEARGASDVLMTGISGGGWTTTLAAAVDTRIDVSVPVSGSLPLFVRPHSPGSVTTDPEQVYPDTVFGDTSAFGYLNLYALGSSGDRVQVQVINQNDPCCFGGDAHAMYSGILHDADSSWSVFVDSTHSLHQVSAAAIQQVILVDYDEVIAPPTTTTTLACAP